MKDFSLTDLYLLTGKPVPIPKVGELKQKRLMDIATIGIEHFNKMLSLLVFDVDELEIEEAEELGLETFDILLFNCLQKDDFVENVEQSLSFFFEENIYFSKQYGFFFVEDLFEQRFINKENYESIKIALKVMNGLDKRPDGKPIYNPGTKGAAIIAEQLNKARETIAKLKQKKGSKSIEFSDLISAFCAYSNTNIIDVWNFTLYQFNNQFQRSQIIQDYDIKIKSVLAGADPKKMDLEHYVKKM